jgi:hypothetical protein
LLQAILNFTHTPKKVDRFVFPFFLIPPLIAKQMSATVVPFAQRPQGDVICLFGKASPPLLCASTFESRSVRKLAFSPPSLSLSLDVDGTLTPARRVSLSLTVPE